MGIGASRASRQVRRFLRHPTTHVGETKPSAGRTREANKPEGPGATHPDYEIDDQFFARLRKLGAVKPPIPDNIVPKRTNGKTDVDDILSHRDRINKEKSLASNGRSTLCTQVSAQTIAEILEAQRQNWPAEQINRVYNLHPSLLERLDKSLTVVEQN